MKRFKVLMLALSCCFMSATLAKDDSVYMESWYAGKFKVSLSKAKVRISIGMKAREIANTLDLEDSISGGMYIENSPKFRIIFNVKRNKLCKGAYTHNGKLCNELESKIQKIIKKEYWDLFATINRVSYSLADLKKTQDRLQGIVKKYATDGAKLLTLIQDGSITLRVTNVAKFKNTLLKNKVTLPKNVKLEEHVEHVKLSAVFGGADANGFCTFGFVVQDSKGVKGVSTAEHCGENVSWGDTPLKHKGRLLSRDTQWFELPPELQKTAKNNIVTHLYKRVPSFKSLSGTTVLGVGNPVCMFGAEGGRKCGVVFAVNQILAEPNPLKGVISNFENLTIVTANGKQDGGGLSIGGDSGGPYYAYDNAVGQVVGGDKAASYYTPIANITSMGVRILTQ